MPSNILGFSNFLEAEENSGEESIYISEDKRKKSDDESFSAQGHDIFFTETMNSLDTLFSIVLSVENDEDNKQKEILKYTNAIKSLRSKADGSLEGIKDVWKEINALAKEMLPSAVRKIQESPAILDFKNSIEDLKSKKNSGDITDEEFSNKIKNLKEKAIEDTKSNVSFLNLNDYSKASKLLFISIDKFTQGAFKELERSKDFSNRDRNLFLERISDFITKTLSEERKVETTSGEAAVKRKKEKEYYSQKSKEDTEEIQSKIENTSGKKEEPVTTIKEKKLVEGFGGFLKSAGGFARGVGQGLGDMLDKSVFASKDKEAITKNSIIQSSEALKTSIMAIATEIDNVIAFQRNTTDELGDKTKEREESARSDAQPMTEFLRTSFSYVLPENIKKEIDSQPLSRIKNRLDKISSELKIMIRTGGQLDKWKDRVMGKGRESVISAGFLDKGLKSQREAKEILSSIVDRKYTEERIKEMQPQTIFKKAVDVVAGKKEDGPKETLIKRKGPSDYSYFPDKPTSKHKDAIKEFQGRLKKMKYLDSGFSEGEYDQPTKDAASRAFHFLGTVTGKVYSTQGDAFRDFQQDLGFYLDNEDKIKKKLAVK